MEPPKSRPDIQRQTPSGSPPKAEVGGAPKSERITSPDGLKPSSAKSEVSGVVRSPAADAEDRPSPAKSSFPPDATLPAICDFGRFELLGRLAFGGMAEIFLAREHVAEAMASRYLVVKRILPHVADDQQFMEMFLDEARLAMQLSHPNICHIYEFGEEDHHSFIAMEWVNGVTLGKLIRRARKEGGVPPAFVARVIAKIAGALHHAHRARDQMGRPLGIVHRDVSPHNVMVAYDGAVKLLDFGIAKASSHQSKTAAGVIKGKFAYMAPEQCLGKDLDGRCDVFALGVCFYEALTGKHLYHQKTEYETMRAVIDGPIPSIRDANADLPIELDAIVQKALHKDREERFESAGAMENALEEWLAESRQVVTDAKLSDYMEGLYVDEIERGPLVDSTPFGQSIKKRPPQIAPGLDESSEPVAIEVQLDSQPAGPPEAKKRSKLLALAAAVTLVVAGVGGGMALGGDGDATVVNAVPAPASVPVPALAPEPELILPEVATPQVAVPTTGTASLTSLPPGATVTLGDRELEGTTPLTVEDLEAGTYSLTFALAGHRPASAEVEVEAGAEATVEASLDRLRRAPATPPGRLSINTRPWSKVYVGRRLLGTTPIGEVRVPSGTVRLRLVDRDGNTHRKTVRVPAGEDARVFYDLR